MKTEIKTTKTKLVQAFKKAGTISGAARIIGCSRVTFRKKWGTLVGTSIGNPVRRQANRISEQTHIPDINNVQSRYADTRVEEIVKQHYKQRGNENEQLVNEVIDKIDALTLKEKLLSGELEQVRERLKTTQDHLYGMRL